MIEDQTTRVKNVIGEVLKAEATHDLVELKVAHHGRSMRLQVFVDSDDGVTLGDCVKLSRSIDREIETQELIEGPYTIEVSSPGIDRPISSEKEFRRKLGRTIAVSFRDTERKQLRGVLKSVVAGEITVETKKSGIHSATLEEILEAKEYI